MDLVQHQPRRLLQALGPHAVQVHNAERGWQVVVVVDAASEEGACAQAITNVTAAAAIVGLGPWHVQRCAAGPEHELPAGWTRARSATTAYPGGAAETVGREADEVVGTRTIRGTVTVNGRRGWWGPLRLLRVLLLPGEFARHSMSHLYRRSLGAVVTFTVPTDNASLLSRWGPTRPAAQALHRRAFDRQLRRRVLPDGADARGRTRYRRASSAATPDD